MYGPIVAGLTSHSHAWDALELAAGLCQQASAGLLAVHVPHGEERFMPYDQPYQQELRERMQTLREEIAPALARVPDGRRREVRAFHAPTVAAGLSELAASEGAPLLVLGSSHRTPVGRVLLGSTGSRLLTHSPCPLAVAPRGLVDRPGAPLRTLGVALDGCQSSEAALIRARELARDLGAELVALSVAPHHGPIRGSWEPARRQMASQTDAMLERAGLEDVERLILGGPTVRSLAEASENLDLLVVGCRKTGGVAGHPTLTSVSRRLMATAACPLVIVPETLIDRGGAASSTVEVPA